MDGGPVRRTVARVDAIGDGMAREPEDARPEATSRRRAAVAGAVALAVVAAAVAVAPVRAPLVVIVGLIVLIALHEAGHLVAARWCGIGAPEFSVGFGPVVLATRARPGGTRIVLRALPLGGFVAIDGLSDRPARRGRRATAAPGGAGRSFLDVSPGRQAVVALAGPLANVAAAAALVLAILLTAGTGSPTTTVSPMPGFPAATAGVQAGDRITAVGATSVRSWDDLTAAVAAAPAGEALRLVVERRGAPVTVDITPTLADERVVLGVAPHLDRLDVAVGDALLRTPSSTWDRFTGSVSALTRIVDGVGSLPAQLEGTEVDPTQRFLSPLGIARAAEGAGERDGLAGPVELLVSVSLFLAVFNLLPIPPLDGGHVVVAAYEAVASRVRRRRVIVDRSRLVWISATFTSLLVVVGAGTLLLDLIRPLTTP